MFVFYFIWSITVINVLPEISKKSKAENVFKTKVIKEILYSTLLYENDSYILPEYKQKKYLLKKSLIYNIFK